MVIFINDCNNCSVKEICTIYNNIKKYAVYADISITNCTKFNHSSQHSISNIEAQIQPVLTSTIKQYKDFSSASKEEEYKSTPQKEKIEIPEGLDIKILGESPVTDSIFIECPSCKGRTTDDDLNLCTKCKEIVCSGCGTSTEGKILCPKCWQEEE